ncbi:hypothetical protein [Rubrobacter aplysinae]|uniref:hypothetical protein n=1 Tax=Rubrobacter aplysinae TaxID=909625 RepID=UPI00064C01A8|nr:hypothetical protein [Rubrobacter aplysinae]
MGFKPVGAGEFDGVGAWSSWGEFLGGVAGSVESEPDGAQSDYLQVGRGGSEGGISFILHRFTRAGEEGYRVQVREWDGAEGESSYWIAPTVEDEGYIGMFTEEEARREFPYLFAAREMPGGFDIG